MNTKFKIAVAFKNKPEFVFACEHGRLTFEAYSDETKIRVWKLASKIENKIRKWKAFRVKKGDLIFFTEWTNSEMILAKRIVKRLEELSCAV